MIVPEVVDFVDKLLWYEHQEWPTTKEAMAHPYFNPMRCEKIVEPAHIKSMMLVEIHVVRLCAYWTPNTLTKKIERWNDLGKL